MNHNINWEHNILVFILVTIGNTIPNLHFTPEALTYVLQNLTYIAGGTLAVLNIYRWFIPKKRK